MKNQPFIIPLIGLILGIVLYDCSSRFPNYDFTMGVAIVILPVLVFVYFFRRYLWVLFLSLFVLLGFFLSRKYNSYSPLPDELKNTEVLLNLKIKDGYRSSEKFEKYKAELNFIDSLNVLPVDVLLYWKKENPNLYHGDEVWIRSKILDLTPAKNPHQFDYSKYLERQRIHYTVFSDTVFKKNESGKSLDYIFSSYKTKVLKKLLDAGYSKNSSDLIGAMLLGDRTEIDRDMEESFRKTGVVHILAISGLHVMMVFSIFMLLFYPLLWLPHGKNIRILVSLLLLWLFVLFVGFKAPVFRSALMISIYYITVIVRRKPNVYHTLSLSAFILLLINPNFIFDPGFLLSYSAVFFIVYLNPVLIGLFKPKKRLSKAITVFFATTISAQAGTFPIAVYFFNLSSGLFIAGNLVMILASYFMIAGGMLSVFLTETGLNFSEWVWVFNKINEITTSYIQWLSSFKHFVFDKIHINPLEVILIFLFLLSLRLILTQPKFRHVFFGLSVILLFQVQRIYQNRVFSSKKELVVFHQNRNSVLGIRDGRNMDVFIGDAEDSANIYNYIIKPYEINERIKHLKFHKMEDSVSPSYLKTSYAIAFEDRSILMLDRDYHKTFPDVDFILIRNNSKIKPDSVSSRTQVIIDGSNYPNYKTEGFNNEIWRTYEKGAKVIRLN